MKTIIIILVIAVALGIVIKWVFATRKDSQLNIGHGGNGSEINGGSKPEQNNQST